MNPITLEWVKKAEGDFAAAQLLARASLAAHADTIAFHAQQVIEKYLKAWLQEVGIPFRKTHDLRDLLQAAAANRPSWASWEQDFVAVTVHAVSSRYPGASATPAEAQHALKVCEQTRLAIRGELGVPP